MSDTVGIHENRSLKNLSGLKSWLRFNKEERRLRLAILGLQLGIFL